MGSEPAIVTQNKGNGSWLDFWMICDAANWFGTTVIALSDSNAFNQLHLLAGPGHSQ
jgi:hypothetical protein